MDLVFTNFDELIHNLHVSSPCHSLFSDHSIISFHLQTAKLVLPSVKPRFVFDFPKANLDGLCEFLLEFDFDSCFTSDDVEGIWSTIKQAIHEGMHLFIPKVRIRSYQYPAWFTPKLRHLSKRIRSLRKRCLFCPTTNDLNKLQCLQECLQNNLSLSKTNFEANLINSISSKKSKIFDYIKSTIGHNLIPPSVYLDSTQVCNDLDSANLFNSYFHSVFSRSTFCLPHLYEMPTPTSALNNIFITECEVYNALISLDPNKSKGPDGIGPKILKHCALAVYQPIHHLFCVSLSQQVIPIEWKYHSVTPLYKSGDRSSVKNYRPISLLCITSKVLEFIIFHHIYGFISNQISHLQFGFLKHQSCVQQLLVSLNNIINSFNNSFKPQVDTIYLDFRKAFDSVPHNKLLVKLWHLGITSNLWNWFRAYLTHRSQYVSINNHHSAFLPVLSGVPQGSILGPLLFLVYINDLPVCVSNSSLLLFADDTKCSKSIINLTDASLLQNDLDGISVWSKQWNLFFNESKCALISFCRAHPHFTQLYLLNNQEITRCHHHKDLGVIWCNNLSWSDHIQYISARAYKMLGLLRRTFSRYNSHHSKKLLYIHLVRSQLIYCSQIWRPYLLKDIIVLENVQRRGTKFILNDFTADYKTRLLSLNLLPLAMLYELNDILFFIKSLKKPTTAFHILDYVSFCSNSTRSASFTKLVNKSARTNTINHSYFYRLSPSLEFAPPN